MQASLCLCCSHETRSGFLTSRPISHNLYQTQQQTPRVASRSHTFLEIDLEIISTVILLLPLIQEGLLSDMYVHKVLVNCLVKLAQEKSVL